MGLRFEKWQALGNDYLIVEEQELPFELTAARVRLICDSHFGCHSDGVLLLLTTDDARYAARLRIFNPDGSEAELSGNGAREAILYLRRSGWTEADSFSIITEAGEITPTLTSDRTCSVAMGRASLTSGDYPGGGPDGSGEVATFKFQHVHIGNPQCAIEVGARLEQLDLPKLGPGIETAELFPNRTNVSFYRVDGEHDLRARIFERGVGETLSSGTGASGAAVAAVVAGKAKSPVTVTLDGGQLEVAVSDDLEVTLSGWAEPVFSAEFSDQFVDALKTTTD